MFKGKTRNKERGQEIKNKEEPGFLDDEGIAIASEDMGSNYNGNNRDIQSAYTNENGQTKFSKNKETENLKANADIPLLSENEKRELVSLVEDKNISIDFILEMKEAFLLFDKV